MDQQMRINGSLQDVHRPQKNLKFMFQNLVEFWNAHGLVQARDQPTYESSSASVYRRNTQERIQEISRNLSEMLVNSSREIDRICSRVKECLSQMDDMNRSNISTATTEVSVIESLSDDPPEIPKTDEQKKLSPFFTIISRSNDRLSTLKNNIPVSVAVCRNKLSSAGVEQSTHSIEMKMSKTSEDEYEFMDKIIDNLNKDIANLSRKSTQLINCQEQKRDKHKELEASRTRDLADISESNLDISNLEIAMEEFKPSDIIPEVYHRPAITDLHEKLLMQIEANDSLIYFQKMMQFREARLKKKNKLSQLTIHDHNTSNVAKTPNTPSRKHSSCRDFVVKYKDSLWFSDRYKDGKKMKRTRKSSSTQQFKTDVSNFSIKASNEKKIEAKRKCKNSRSNISMISNRSFGSGKELKRSNKKTEVSKKNHLKMSISTNIPSGSLYNFQLLSRSQNLAKYTKCRFRWMKAKAELAPFRRLDFLDILDDLTHRDLEPLQSEYPRKDNFRVGKRDVRNTYLYRLVHGRSTSANTWKYLLHAQMKNSGFPLNKEHMIKIEEQEENSVDEMQSFNNYTLSRTEVVKKLSAYIYDPENPYYRTMVVMPVRVFYDNQKNAEISSKMHNTTQSYVSPPPKLPLLPMKEPKVISNRASWSSPTNTKICTKLSLSEGTANRKIQSSEPSKVLTTKIWSRDETICLPKKGISKSSPPKCFEPFCKHPDTATMKRTPTCIESLPTNQTLSRPPTFMNKNFQKRMWAYKYKKPVNEQLLHFIENQPILSQSQPHKHAPPVSRNVSDPNNLTDLHLKDKQHMKSSKVHQQCKTADQKEKRIVEQKNVKQGFVRKTMIPHRRMLDQLKGLKQKNDVIQNNIQKAINVIETKMVHLLSTTDKTNSVEAFNCMEKEITNVLTMMKRNGEKELQNVPEKESHVGSALEEEFDIISDQVFMKLNHILDISRSRSNTGSTASEKTNNLADKQLETKLPYSEIPMEMIVVEKNMIKAPRTPLTAIRKDGNEQKSKFSTRNDELISQSSSEHSENARQDCCGDISNQQEDRDKTSSVDELSDNSKGDCLMDKPENIQTDQRVEAVDVKVEENAGAKEYCSAVSSVKILPKPAEESADESSMSFSDNVNRIIKRVEDIYSQLDDIQGTEHIEMPRFLEEATVGKINSEEFLTPFMQAVKDKREHSESTKKMLQKSPSFYNVLSFLDTLSDIREEKPQEVYTTRLHNYSYIVHFPKILNQSRIIHRIKLQKIEIPSCLKKSSEDSCKVNKKRVSFLVIHEDKSSQAVVCPVHSIKEVSVCSEQFPPQMEYSILETITMENKNSCEKEQQKSVCDSCKNLESKQNFDCEQQSLSEKSTCLNTSVVSKDNETYCGIQMSNTDDKTTQVYRTTKKNQSCFEVVKLTQQLENDETQCLKPNACNNYSQAPHINIFYDKSDVNLPKVTLNREQHNGTYCKETILKVKNFKGMRCKIKPKVVVFRETSDLLRPLKYFHQLSDSALADRHKNQDPIPLVKLPNETSFREVEIMANINKDEQREVFLKSVYAIVYILMFTALNMEYRCQ